MTRRILVPLDGRPETETILEEVRRVAAPGAEVHLLHAVPLALPPVGTSPTRFLDLPERAMPYLEGLRGRLAEFRGLNHSRPGEPAETILAAALELNIDLIAMCTHARKGLPRWFMGSVAEAVVRKSRLPVLLSRPSARPARSELRRILVPLDGSEYSSAILDTVCGVAAGPKAELVLLHVESLVRDPAPQWAFSGRIAVRESAEHRFQRMADALEARGFTAYPVMAHGDVPAEILNQARSLDADLIAMSTHARSGLDRAVMGSVAELVLRNADRAVLLHRPDRMQAEEGEADEA
jgi:nucleotide-binding universal stress UspA family protein